jgi:hypothetical protein
VHWQTILRFGDAHPWFLPSFAAIVTLLAAAYKSTAWMRRSTRNYWECWEDKLIGAYLSQQVNPGPFEPDSYGHTPRKQKDCSSIEIAEALGKKPVTVSKILDRLEKQQRARRRGTTDNWWATDYQVRQPIGMLVKARLEHLKRKSLSRLRLP